MTQNPGGASRARLLAIIQQRRGLHKSELMRLAGRGWGNIGHHLDVLIRERQVETEVRGRLLWIFHPSVGRTERELIVATFYGPARRILEFLGLRQRATVRTLSEELAVSKKVIRFHLSTLQRADAVQRLEGHPPAFAPAQQTIEPRRPA